MKKQIMLNRLLILLIFFLAPGLAVLHAQVRVTKLTGPESLNGKKGIVYNLPMTVIGVEIEVVKTQQFPGPLAEYAQAFLGLSEVVMKSSVEYRLESASLTSCTEPDPGQAYIIEKEEKAQGEIWIAFSPSGTVASLESFPKSAGPDSFSKWDNALFQETGAEGLYSRYSATTTREVVDTMIRKISIDTLVVEEKVIKRSMVAFPNREKAQVAADRIRKIDGDIYNLLIGYQETAYSREAIEFMYEKLQQERQEYLELFTGAIVTEKLVFHFRIVPDTAAENQEYILAGFSSSAGLFPAGEDNTIRLIISSIPEMLEATNPAGGQNSTGLVYRVPLHLPVVVDYNGKELASGRIELLQFGPLVTLPAEFKKIEFDPLTGAFKAIVIE